MSDIQKILVGIAAQMHDDILEATDLLRIVILLNGVPEYYHKAAVLAAFDWSEGKEGEKEEEDDAE